MRTSLLGGIAAALALSVVGCGGGGDGGVDDAGPGAIDAGRDAAARIDAGDGDDASAPGDDASAPGDDASVPGDDAAVPGDDASVPGDDAAVPGDDAGVPGDDAGVPGDDAGVPGDDAGAPAGDAGAAADAGTAQPDAGTGGCARCRAGEYCATPDGMCSVAGSCQPRPDFCLGVFDPVCGCDGMTYSNACAAHQAGQSVASDGACPATTDCRTTGCRAPATCEPCRGGAWACIPRGSAC